MKKTTNTRSNGAGTNRTLVSIDGERVSVVIVDEIIVPHGENKRFYFQRMEVEQDGRTEYRLAYYTRGRKREGQNRWVFGQYSAIIPAAELGHLLREAKNRHWPGIE